MEAEVGGSCHRNRMVQITLAFLGSSGCQSPPCNHLLTLPAALQA